MTARGKADFWLSFMQRERGKEGFGLWKQGYSGERFPSEIELFFPRLVGCTIHSAINSIFKALFTGTHLSADVDSAFGW